MLQRVTHILATLAALAALGVGLAGGWEFWSIVRRATLRYVGMYIACGVLLLLGRFALQSAPPPSREGTRSGAEPEGTGGTDAAP